MPISSASIDEIFQSGLAQAFGGLGGVAEQQRAAQTATEAQMTAERQLMAQQQGALMMPGSTNNDINIYRHQSYGQSIRLTQEALMASVFNNAFGTPQKAVYQPSKYKTYSSEKFNNMTSEPVIKDILPGSYKLNKEEAKNRIREHVEALV